MAELRTPNFVVEPLAEGDATNLRIADLVVEPLAEGASPNLRIADLVVEPLAEGDHPNLRVALFVVEALISIPEEGELATDLFPIGFGLSWTTHKIPNFVTQVRPAASLKTVRNSLTPYPAWDFEVSFVYLPSDAPFLSGTANPDLQEVLGFFLKMRGRAKAFLFRDPQDYRVRAGAQGTGDGVTTEFKFARALPGWSEPVGQVDLLERFSFAPGHVTAAADTIAHAAHGLATADGPFFVASTTTIPPGLAATTPYWAIKVDADTIKLAASRANALAGTAVNITGAGAGVHSLTGGWAVYDAGVLQTGVTFNTPNGFTFAVAPTAAHAITADFDFLFVCHFEQDAADFEQFNRDLFQLQQVRFRADPP
jgi:hypothetical protein